MNEIIKVNSERTLAIASLRPPPPSFPEPVRFPVPFAIPVLRSLQGRYQVVRASRNPSGVAYRLDWINGRADSENPAVISFIALRLHFKMVASAIRVCRLEQGIRLFQLSASPSPLFSLPVSAGIHFLVRS